MIFGTPYRCAGLEKRAGGKVRKDSTQGGGRVTEREGRKGSGSPWADEARRWLMHPRVLHSPLQPSYSISSSFFFSSFLYLSIYLPTAATSIRARSRNFWLASGRTRPSVRVMCHEHSATEIFHSYLSFGQKEINVHAGCSRIYLIKMTLCIVYLREIFFYL